MNREDRDTEVLVYQILWPANQILLFDRFLAHDSPTNDAEVRPDQREMTRVPVSSGERIDLPAVVGDTDPDAVGKQDKVLIG